MSLLSEADIAQIVNEKTYVLDVDQRAPAEKFADRIWRLNHLYHILNAQGHKVIFRMNDEQRDLLDNVWYLNLILKARQLGFTTLICILFLDICLFNSNIHAGIIAHNREDAQDFFENKVEFAYNNLPESLRAARVPDTERANKLSFNNDSSIRVGTSLRSGTYQYLHISEFGKICARYPEKAREIVTGALNTVHAGQYVFIESTAEGQGGYFHDFCKDAEKRQQMGRKPNQMEYKLHFYPWWKKKEYRIDPEGMLFTKEVKDYFTELETKHKVFLDDKQKAWYAAKKISQGEDMFREFPSVPEEAFKASVQGAFYSKQMAIIRKAGQVTKVPYVPGAPVNLGFDIGLDMTTVWFHQKIALQDRIIDYYENSGEDIDHYIHLLKEEKAYVYGKIYLPHDSVQKRVNAPRSVYDIMGESFKNLVLVERTGDLIASIEDTRRFLQLCWFDEENCEDGIKALDCYRKEWNEKGGTFRETPLHDWASHGADGYRTLAVGLAGEATTQGPLKVRGRSWRTT